ncbi:MAG: PPC domain-containing protein, partial [Bacteroidota bacterium]
IEQEATINLPILDDGVSEGVETATFTLEPGDTYEIVPIRSEAIFGLADTVEQASVPEEIESNSTIPEANALGLSSDSPSVSLRGAINRGDNDPTEDVDFFSFNLEAGQTVSLDIDTEEILPQTLNSRPVVFPADAETLQTPDTELRLFDAEGNELAANNDGAAPDEDFSRDPFIEFTAETAGTYYVGVSQLGNRNYDPFSFLDPRGGSGWTFPEVGVFYGPYELTATLTASDSIDIGLYDADTDTLIAFPFFTLHLRAAARLSGNWCLVVRQYGHSEVPATSGALRGQPATKGLNQRTSECSVHSSNLRVSSFNAST